MALKGNLDPTFLSGLFQIFCDESKTGLFKARFGAVRTEIHIQKGVIVHAAGVDERPFLADILTVRGVLPAEQVDQAVRDAGQSGKSLARTLLDLGLLAQAQLGPILEELAGNLMLMLFQQTSGDFEYEDAAFPLDALVLIHLDIRRAILEAFRLLDEIKEFKRRLPGEEVAFTMLDKARNDTAYQLDAVTWRILSLVHRKHPLKEIVRKSSYNVHTVFGTLIALMDAGMIGLPPGWDDDIHRMAPTAASPPPEAAPAAEEKPREKGLFGFFRKKS